MIKLIDILDEVRHDLKASGQYVINGLEDELQYDTYIALAELLNPEQSYEYFKRGNGWYYYFDSRNNRYDVRVAYDLTNPPTFKFKTWYQPTGGSPEYRNNPENSTPMDWDKKSNTIAKIYRDELIPFLRQQSLSKIMIIEPVDQQRYYFSKRLLQKFNPKGWEIVEEFPTKLTVYMKESYD